MSSEEASDLDDTAEESRKKADAVSQVKSEEVINMR